MRSVVAGRVSSDGQPLDGSGLPLDQKFPSGPAIANGVSQTLVVWGNTDGVVAERLTPSGEVLDTTPISIAKPAHASSLAVAWTGSRYFIVWADGIQFLGAFLGPDGVATAPRPLGVQVGTQVRVSAFGPGGLSAGTITSIGSPRRRHAQRP